MADSRADWRALQALADRMREDERKRRRPAAPARATIALLGAGGALLHAGAGYLLGMGLAVAAGGALFVGFVGWLVVADLTRARQ